ncbi:MAG: isoprenylcysteine carboxylmethyltransferase family protein [Thermoplasmata archaeon]|nr:MAG: isoprenylcysteine carboxylmethyltransferase family protein [Thermoplasmata archaeon]
MGKLRNLKMFILMPLNAILSVTIILLLLFRGLYPSWMWVFPLNILLTIVGLIFIFVGAFLVIKTTILFSKIGNGTVAHWDPPKKLVIYSVYLHMRNPMIFGILLTVFGEIVIFSSLSLVPYFLFLLIGHHLLFTKYEEPELIQRFGEDYILYMKNVPRWIPRLKPWEGFQSGNSKI